MRHGCLPFERKWLITANRPAWLVNCSYQSMKKSLLQTRIEGVTQGRLPEPAGVRGDNPNRAEKPAQSGKLHSQFNPSRIGFGILGAAKDVRHPSLGIDEDITSEIKIEEGQ